MPRLFHRPHPWLLLPAASLAPALLDAEQMYVKEATGHRGAVAWNAVAFQGLEWLFLGAVAPITWVIARRIPFSRARWRAAAAHLAGAAVLCIVTASAAPAQSPAARTGDFDYLLGDWRFAAESKPWGHFVGVWSAVRLATGDGTHILDEYRAVGDSGRTIFASTTLRVLNRPADRWELVTAGPGTGVADRGTAHRVGDEMYVEQVFGAAAGKPEQWRIRYYHIRPDGFSWTGDRSTDGGRTWDAGYLRIEATRVSPPRDLPPLARARVQAPVQLPTSGPTRAP